MSDIEIGRQRLLQVFRFLQAFNERKNPPKKQIREQQRVLWLRDLPEHSAIELTPDAFTDTEFESAEDQPPSGIDGDFILRIGKPTLQPPPAPPPEIADWLQEGWDNPDREAQVRESATGEGVAPVEIDDDAHRLELFDRWARTRAEWAKREKPARAAMRIFESLYDVHSTVERESEQVELVLGDGILNWRLDSGGLHHPIILQRMQLDFDPDVPEFMLRETDKPVELYTSLFRSITEVDGRAIDRLRRELEAGGLHPLGGQRTSEWLHRAVSQLSPRGEFLGDEEPAGEEDYPRIGRQPVVFLRRRSLGFAAAIEAILEDLQSRQDIPVSLLRIVGIDPGSEDSEDVEDDRSVDADDVLLTKPANPEQIRIARRLEKHQAVLVQGPPGTGKTHTIANLLGHLLAQGKKVLVTSHTTKALRVLREQVEPGLRSLCVSVLDTDLDSRAQLQDSIRGTVERLDGKDNLDQFRKKDKSLVEERKRLLDDLKRTREDLLTARQAEYRDIVVAGSAYSPSDAARFVADGRGHSDWVPSPISLGNPLPLSDPEVQEIYRTNKIVAPSDEQELSYRLPEPGELLSPSQFKALVEQREEGQNQPPSDEDLWSVPANDQDADSFRSLIARLTSVYRPLSDSEAWRLAPIDAGLRGETAIWTELLTMIKEASEQAAEGRQAELRHEVVLASDIPLDEQAEVLENILTTVSPGGRVGGITLLLHPRWRTLLRSVTVDGASPRDTDGLTVLLQSADLELERQALRERWQRQMVPLEVPTLDAEDEPERLAEDYVAPIASALSWADTFHRPLEHDLEEIGLQLEGLKVRSAPDPSLKSDALKLQAFMLNQVQPELTRRLHEVVTLHTDETLDNATAFLEGLAGSHVVRDLLEATVRFDVAKYSAAFHRLLELKAKTDGLALRRRLIQKLDQAATGWATAILQRTPPHDEGAPPGDPQAAWLWRQLNDELNERARVSIEALQTRISQLQSQLEQVTADLVEMRAWTRQIERTTHEQQQALVGFAQVIRKIGRGTGKRAPTLRIEAQRLLGKAHDSVPVWIMPLSRVVDSFDMRSDRFDVVIIDEASQSDLLAYIALYAGKQVVIVGDDQQVTPDDVGVPVEETEQLIRTFLQGIPNSQLYDGRTSIYDMAEASFGGLIRLIEHFRCAPDIIQFSNGLCYNWEIRPLRDPGAISTKPHVIEYRAHGSETGENVNDDEAWAVASLIAASIEQPEYGGKTFGAVSLVGVEQARGIDSLLRRYIPPLDYERRHILCGNPAQFQGDERDVMVLSMVYGPGSDGPIRRLGDPGERFKKRYNVAASRARDQMWLVHSLDPAIDLQSGDLRKRLIDHVRDPGALASVVEKETSRAESPFERMVLQELIAAGYEVIPQYRAGYYRIDIAIRGHQVAIECDGERFHTLDNLKDDMERQAVLERLGWRFIRIRGSEFYRDQKATITKVFERLTELGVVPQGATPSERDAASNEITERIIRRAAELRAEWQAAHASMERDSVEDESSRSDSEGTASSSSIRGQSLRRQHRGSNAYHDDEESDPRQQSPATISSPRESPEEGGAAERALGIAAEQGLRVVDKRVSGGALWIIGGPELQDRLVPLGFKFAASGSRSTDGRPGWYLPGNQ